jgi:hypothetical protein
MLRTVLAAAVVLPEQIPEGLPCGHIRVAMADFMAAAVQQQAVRELAQILPKWATAEMVGRDSLLLPSHIPNQ